MGKQDFRHSLPKWRSCSQCRVRNFFIHIPRPALLSLGRAGRPVGRQMRHCECPMIGPGGHVRYPPSLSREVGSMRLSFPIALLVLAAAVLGPAAAPAADIQITSIPTYGVNG